MHGIRKRNVELNASADAQRMSLESGGVDDAPGFGHFSGASKAASVCGVPCGLHQECATMLAGCRLRGYSER